MSSSADAAFAEVTRKAKGGAIGAAIGVSIMLLLSLTLGGPNIDYVVGLGIGAIGGAACGGIMSGRSFAIGGGIITGGAVGMVASFLVLFSAAEPNRVVIAIVAAGVSLGFSAGAGIEIHQATRACSRAAMTLEDAIEGLIKDEEDAA
jgi:hypothetical protein